MIYICETSQEFFNLFIVCNFCCNPPFDIQARSEKKQSNF